MNIFDIKFGPNKGKIVEGETLNLDSLSLGQKFEVISVPVTFSTWNKGDIVEVQAHEIDVGNNVRVLMNLSSQKFRSEGSLKGGWLFKIL